MPANKWNAERNERLLLLIIQDVKLNYEKLQKDWKVRYGEVDEFQPTARAIQEQFKSLCKRAGVAKGRDGKVNDTPSKPKATPNATPRKPSTAVPTTPKTPSSGAKRSRKTMSDDDESEGETANVGSESAKKRTKYDRRSKTPKTYQDPGSEDEAAAEKDAVELGLDGHGSGLGSIFDQELSLDGPADHAAGDSIANEDSHRTMRRKLVDDDAMSDISDFKPDLS